MKRTLLICLLVTFSAHTQSSLIEYDFSNETFSFSKIKKNGKVVQLKKPVHYSGIPTKLVINNINTNFYAVDFEVESYDEKPINSDQSMTGLVENFNTGTQAFNQLVGEVKSNDIYKSLFVDGKFQGIEGMKDAFGMGASEFQQKMEILNDKLEAIEETHNSLKKTSQNLRLTAEKIQLVDFVDNQLYKLQMNSKMAPAEIRTRAGELIQKVLGEKLNLEGVISASNETQDLLNNQYNAFKGTYSKLKLQQQDANDYISSFINQLSAADFKLIVMSAQREMSSKGEVIDENAVNLETLNDSYGNGEIRNLYVSVFEKYDEILHTNYTISYSVNGDKDLTVIKMKFKSSEPTVDSLQVEEEVSYLKTREIVVPTSGGLRINSSAGMAFTSFAQGQYSYSSDQGTVERSKSDAFKPALTTMFHFYKQSSRQVNLGGTFGVAVPIDGDKDFQYLLGGSAIIGKTQRVILNFGAFGGKNQVLSGYSVGEKISAGSIVPTSSIFDFGFFGGVTLNIGQIF